MNSSLVHRRALAKTISWRGLALVFTTLGVWVVTGRLSFAASVGAFEIAVKFGGYYLHERLWEWIDRRGVPNPPSFSWFASRKSQKEGEQCQQLS